MIKNTRYIKNIYFTFIMVAVFALNQQAQIVLNNNAIININGGSITSTSSYLVLNNPPATPIKTVATTAGGIMMETEYSITQYNIGVGTTAITVPYFSTTSGSVQFPLAVTSISGGVGTGNIQFSSKKAPTLSTGFDNVNYMPSDVLNMNGWNANIFTTNNSPHAIDRFWIIDALGYTTTPAVTYDFGYISAEGNANGGNSFIVANLQAEPFDKVVGAWAGSPTGAFPVGANTTGTPKGDVSGVSIAAGIMGTKYRSWTLVDKLNPLPIELMSFAGTCINNGANINWSTASESNSSYFTIEKSYDGQTFTWVVNINAAGNSIQQKNYTYFDANTAAITYYKLSETDKNGSEKTYKIISVENCDASSNESIHVFSGNGNLNVNIYSLSNQAVSVFVYDVTGRIIYKETINAVIGNNNYSINPQVAKGIYMIEVQANAISLVKRVPLID